MSAYIIALFAVGSTSMLIGMVLGRITLLDHIRALELEVITLRRYAGRLGDRIGRQRFCNKKLKAQIKTLATSTPATMEKPSARPNLPH